MIKVIQDDITTLEVDAIVNAANNSLLGGGGVDGAIHRAAGKELYVFNQSLHGCQTGEAKISPGFKLKAKYIIHTVGPVWHGGKENEPNLLKLCYQSSFTLALNEKIKTIAFPAISTGVYGYPKEAAAKIAVNSMRKFESEFDFITACCFCEADVEIYERCINEES